VSGTGYVHAEASALKAGTKYYYNLSMQGRNLLEPDSLHFFYTVDSNPREPVVFGVIGDTRGGAESFHSDHRAVVRSILTYTLPAFLIHTGDMVEAADKNAWSGFFDIQRELLRQCPIYPVRGASERNLKEYADIFHLPGNELWYSFSCGGVLFIGLDIQDLGMQQRMEEHVGPGSDQYRWLADVLESEKREALDFTVVFSHEPFFPVEGPGNPAMMQALCPVFEKYGVDLVLNGRQHYFSYAQHNGVIYLVSGGGGASLDRPRKKESESVEVYHPLFHHLRISVNYPNMDIQGVDNSGTIFFAHSIVSQRLERREIPDRMSGGQSVRMRENRIPVEIFGSSHCLECERLKTRTMVELEKIFRDHWFDVTVTDIDSTENYEKYRSLESRTGSREHSFPVLAIGNRLFSGKDLEPENLEKFIRDQISAGTVPAGGEHSDNSYKKIILSCIALVIVLCLIYAFRRKRS
jgi:hypothetical protein